MENPWARTQLLLGAEAIDLLQKARVAVFGVGGVGSFAVEALARSGVGELVLVDDDEVCVSNINRQIIATTKTVGQSKVEAAKRRVLEINPSANVTVYKEFFTPQTAHKFEFTSYDYVIDAIDTVSGKIELVLQAEKACTPLISCMGAGNKLDPTAFVITDIYKTSVCPLARVMRRELKKRGVKKLKVVYSTEPALVPLNEKTEELFHEIEARKAQGEETGKIARKKTTPGSVSFVPSVEGLIAAGEVIKDLIKTLDTK